METSGIGQTEIQGAPRVLPLGDLCIAAGIPCPAGAEKLQIHGITAASARVAVLYPTEAKAPAEDILPAGTAVGIPLPPDVPARAVFARLVSAWYGDPGRRLHLVGVTGTNGKTTVTAMLCHILRTAGIPCGCIGTLGYQLPAAAGRTDFIRTEPFRPADERAAMTTPEPEELYAVLARMADCAPAGVFPTVVMEVSSHALAQGRVEPLAFDLAVFTNLSPEHLGVLRRQGDAVPAGAGRDSQRR